MPELPEVEVTRQGITPHLSGQLIKSIIVRQAQLRWQIPTILTDLLPGQKVETISRRGKYLLLACTKGHLIIHLGMSGHLRVLPATTPPRKHDHVDIILASAQCLRYHDPRRFGCILWTEAPVLQHALLANLGVEPLSTAFDGAYLKERARGRQLAVKNFIMDSHIVVGVGNIYANESLFQAGIHPQRAAKQISLARYQALAEAIRTVLSTAIAHGGTTLRDFTHSDGKPGYFRHELQVYGRAGEPCMHCGELLDSTVIGQRATYFCRNCQR